MKTNKNKTLYFIVLALIFGLFNLIVFLLPFKRIESFWVGYSFITLAAVISAVVFYLIFDKKDLKSRFYRVPLIYILSSYLVLQLILSSTQMVYSFRDYKYGIVVNAIVLVASAIGLIGVGAGVDEIERIDQKVKEKVLFIQEILVKLDSLIDNENNEAVIKELKKLLELIKYSDPMGNEHVEELEKGIAVAVDLLKGLNAEEKITKINEIEKLVKERNRLVKLNK